jgi:hypothetical protein
MMSICDPHNDLKESTFDSITHAVPPLTQVYDHDLINVV